MRLMSSDPGADTLPRMLSRSLPRIPLALAAVAAAMLGGAVAQATEIAVPRPDPNGTTSRAPTATLSRWIGAPPDTSRPAAISARTIARATAESPRAVFVGTLPGPDSPTTSLVVPLAAPNTGIGLRLGSIYARNLPPLSVSIVFVSTVLLSTEAEASPSNGFQLVLGSYAGAALTERLAVLSAPPSGALAGGTRFDVRPADRNAIALRSPVVERLVERVVRTPEPSTLALFATGLVGLLALVRRGRRATCRDSV